MRSLPLTDLRDLPFINFPSTSINRLIVEIASARRR